MANSISVYHLTDDLWCRPPDRLPICLRSLPPIEPISSVTEMRIQLMLVVITAVVITDAVNDGLSP